MARHKANKQRSRTQATSTPSGLTITLQQANQLLQQGQLQQAINLCRQSLKKLPGEPQLLNMLGILYSQLDKPEAAEKHLKKATLQAPDEPVYHYNLGKILCQHNKLKEALDSYHAALAINPNLAEPHLNIGNILKLQEQLPEAINSYQQALRCNPDLPVAHYNLSVIYKELDQLTSADYHCREAIKLKPDYDLAYDHLGTILSRLNKQQEAIQCHQQAIHCNPGLAEAHYNLCLIYKDLKQLSTASDHCHQAIKLKPDYAAAHNHLGAILSAQDDAKNAIHHHHRAIELQPESADYYHSLGRAYMVLGDFTHARTCFQQAIDRNPGFCRSHYDLALLTKHKADDPAIPAMQVLLNQAELGLDDKIHLKFALGKACDDAKEYDAAFNYYQQGNRDKRSLFDYSAENDAAFTRSLITTYNAELLSRLGACGTSDATPIFIVGMPRSGTTLIEQILSNHPDVHTAGEMQTLTQIFNDEFGTDNIQEKIKKSTEESFVTIGEKYIKRLRELAPSTRHIIDKMPHNFLYIGIIALALPNAKIIHCQRNPIDTCLSCFMQLFSSGHHYSYSLEELGKHYLSYQEIMAYWHKLLPGKILDIQYENVVNDLQAQARRLIDYCDLPWNESCLEFHRSNQPVKTASRDQVNKPIYKNSVQRWKHYERHLQPLLDIINKPSSS